MTSEGKWHTNCTADPREDHENQHWNALGHYRADKGLTKNACDRQHSVGITLQQIKKGQPGPPAKHVKLQ